MNLYSRDFFKPSDLNDLNSDNISLLSTNKNTMRLDYLNIKLTDNLNITIKDNRLVGKTENENLMIETINEILPNDCNWERLYKSVSEENLNNLVKKAKLKTNKRFPNFNLEFVVTSLEGFTLDMIKRLLNLNFVERVSTKEQYIREEIPDLEHFQRFLNYHYYNGIYAKELWDLGITGKGIKVAVIEKEFIPHTDIPHVKATTSNDYEIPNNYHATACLGIIGAKRNGKGTTGIAYDVELYHSSTTTSSIEDSILDLINNHGFGEGDVMSISLNVIGLDDIHLPIIWRKTIYDVIGLATSLGIVVCAAAGNHNIDLDDPKFDINHRPFNPDYSCGGVIVGGCTHDFKPIAFTSYGQIVKVSAFAENVPSTGYKNSPYGSGTIYYGGTFDTSYFNFSGTSAATPFVAACIALIQSHRKKRGLPTYNGFEIQDLLYNTGKDCSGYNGDTYKRIGKFPDLKKALDLEDRIEIQRSLDGIRWDFYDAISIKEPTYIDVNVEPNTRYFYRCRRVKKSTPSKWSNIVSVNSSDGIDGLAVAILDISKLKISRKDGHKFSTVKFKVNKDIVGWEARAVLKGQPTGIGIGDLVGQKTI